MMKTEEHKAGRKVVAIASSTGGPKALQNLIPLLPSNLNAPVLIVQHMPAGFTEALAERINNLSQLSVKEAQEGDVLVPGQALLARGGRHMNVVKSGAKHVIHYSDEPPREGVRPCANYMYESLAGCGYEEVICAVLSRRNCRNQTSQRKEKGNSVCAERGNLCGIRDAKKHCAFRTYRAGDFFRTNCAGNHKKRGGKLIWM